MGVVAVVLPVVMATIFAVAGAGMAKGDAAARGTAARLDLPLRRFRAIGVLQLAGAVGLMAGLLLTPLGVAASAGLLALMIGAGLAHLRAHDPLADLAPAVACLLGAAGCLALFAS